MATSLATALLPAPQLGLGESILFGVGRRHCSGVRPGRAHR